ncbi:MAG TPA: hypothetical protein VM658_04445 [bacterium]|nr:hypothetical protein [bacterium]
MHRTFDLNFTGNADLSGGDVPGADGIGGGIDLFSEWKGAIFQGAYNILGGSADTDRLDGQLCIDGTLIDGVMPPP